MKNMRSTAITAAISMLLLTVIFGIAYPLAITGAGQVLFPGNANGQQVKVDGKLVGSKLIGQQFSKPVIGANGKPKLDEEGNPVTEPDPRYFQSRPSATVPAGNAAASTFSNLGPNNVATKEAIEEHVKEYLALNGPYVHGLDAADVPVDAATASGSGLDPEISEANAAIQAHRVAAVRRLPLARVQELVADHTSGRSLGVFGEPGVNVLELNRALDELEGGN
jgi:potassium-transporting ATPase KdpC subunit